MYTYVHVPTTLFTLSFCVSLKPCFENSESGTMYICGSIDIPPKQDYTIGIAPNPQIHFPGEPNGLQTY